MSIRRQTAIIAARLLSAWPDRILRLSMEYRGIEYSVVQGVERDVWKWYVNLDRAAIRETVIPLYAVTDFEKSGLFAGHLSNIFYSGCAHVDTADDEMVRLGRWGFNVPAMGASPVAKSLRAKAFA